MAESATVRVSEKTNERLRRRKRDDESFNDVITRLLDEDRDLLAGFGAGNDRTGERLAESLPVARSAHSNGSTSYSCIENHDT